MMLTTTELFLITLKTMLVLIQVLILNSASKTYATLLDTQNSSIQLLKTLRETILVLLEIPMNKMRKTGLKLLPLQYLWRSTFLKLRAPIS